MTDRSFANTPRHGLRAVRALAGGLVLLAAGSAHADGLATIVVNSSEDIVADDGKCTLREAVNSANTQAPSGSIRGECKAGGMPTLIDLSAMSGTVTLVGGALEFHQLISIKGPGKDKLTILSGGAPEVFHFNRPESNGSMISGVTEKVETETRTSGITLKINLPESPDQTPTMTSSLEVTATTPTAADDDSNIIVNSNDDVVADDGFCTLREAVKSAITRVPSGTQPGECIAGTALGFIDLRRITGSITLAGSPIEITRRISMRGPGLNFLTIHSGAAPRIFSFVPGTDAGMIAGVTLATTPAAPTGAAANVSSGRPITPQPPVP